MILEVAAVKREGDTSRACNEAALIALGLDSAPDFEPQARVAIGFVDYGFDLLHPCLRSATGETSRFRFLWDQNCTPDVRCNGDLALGRLADWDGVRLDAEVKAAAVSGSRRALDQLYDPHANNCGRHGTVGGAHGTMMASIAAATPFAGFRGAAPGTELIGVQLALLDADWKEEDRLGQPTWMSWNPTERPTWNGWRSYDDAPQIISAVRYIYDRGCRLGVDALVINLSIGAWAGVHDGTSPVERAIGDLIDYADAAFRRGHGPRTIVVAGAGNAGADEGHWTGIVGSSSPQSFDWVMQRCDQTQNKLEIWYEASTQPINIVLTLPDGSSVPLTPGRTHEIVAAGARIGIADHGLAVRDDRACVRLLIHPPFFAPALFEGAADACACTLSLTAGNGNPIRVHAWVERDDGVAERSWLAPSHVESSLCCLATVPGVVVVGGYDHHLAADEPGILPVSSLGPAPWASGSAARVPHFVAPAHRIWGARSKSRGFCVTTGTSAAVALTSGVIAHHLARHGVAAALPRATGRWNPRFGYGPFKIESVVRRGVDA
jgi:hypothetical protein